MTKLDFLMVLPPVKPFLRPLDLTFPFHSKMKNQKKSKILPLQAGPLSITTILAQEGNEVKLHDFCHFEKNGTLTETIKDLIQTHDPDVIGAYSYTAYLSGLKYVFDLLRKKIQISLPLPEDLMSLF